MAQQGGKRFIRAGQCVQTHHLCGGAGCRCHHPALHLLLRRLHLGGGHTVPLRQPQTPRQPDRDTGAGKLLQSELHPDRGAAGQAGFLRLFCRFRPTGAHRHRPARRAEKEPVLHRRPHGAGRAGVLCLRAEQQNFLSGNGCCRLRGGKRRASDAAVSGIGHPSAGRQRFAAQCPGVQAAGDPARHLRRHAGDDGGGGAVRRRTQRTDRGLPGGRQKRHQPEAGQRRRESPHRQLCGSSAH